MVRLSELSANCMGMRATKGASATHCWNSLRSIMKTPSLCSYRVRLSSTYCRHGSKGESDPYVVAEGGNLGTPDRAKAQVFGKKRVLDGSGAGRQAEVIGQHGAYPSQRSHTAIHEQQGAGDVGGIGGGQN